ncbi:MAG: hypothetical protein IBX68_10385 [Dehalococcoidia bacterium]|nr:hypothetical protein [Dehalococcoidia bacterium]
MKVTEHVEHLLRKGRSPEELLELGFSKVVVTKVRRQLRQEKASRHAKAPKGGGGTKVLPQVTVRSAEEAAAMPQRLTSMESGLKAIEGRVEELEARLSGTPVLGLRRRFKCQCGATGLLAVRIQCTRCGRETWWGWFPEK